MTSSAGDVITAMAQVAESQTSNISKYLDYYAPLYVHPFYYEYLEYIYTLPDVVYWIIGLYVAIICGMGTLGNLLVIYIFAT